MRIGGDSIAVWRLVCAVFQLNPSNPGKRGLFFSRMLTEALMFSVGSIVDWEKRILYEERDREFRLLSLMA